MSRTQLLILLDPVCIEMRKRTFNGFTVMTVNNKRLNTIQTVCSTDHMFQQCFTTYLMQYFRCCRIHAFALAGCENHNTKRHKEALLISLSRRLYMFLISYQILRGHYITYGLKSVAF